VFREELLVVQADGRNVREGLLDDMQHSESNQVVGFYYDD
jgi:hypothetical protein